MNSSRPKVVYSPRRQLLLLLAVSAAIALLFDLSVYRLIFAHPLDDQSWLLYAAGCMLHGTQLYGPRLIETNPPLIIWFSAFPVFLAALFHTSSLVLFQATVCGLIILSTLWLVRILRFASIVRGRVMTWVTLLVILAVESAPVDSTDFGQREHLLVLLLLPFVIASVLKLGRTLNAPERIALGVVGGLAICFKPQQSFIVFGFELFLIFWSRGVRRLWRLELVCLAFTVLAYITLVSLCTPLYFRQIVPLLRDTYLSYGDVGAGYLLKSLVPFFIGWFAVLLVWFWKRRHLRTPVAPLALLVCSGCAAVAYYIQHKAFVYQAIPQNIFLLFAAAWLILELLGPSAAEHLTGLAVGKRMLAYGLLFVILFSPPLLLHARKDIVLWRQPTNAQAILSHYPPGTPVYILSASLLGFHPVLQDHLVWGSRYAHLWMLPSIVLSKEAASEGRPTAHRLSSARLQQLAELQRETVAEDLDTWKPVVVLVERCTPIHSCQALDLPSFDTLAWFLRSPAFSAQWKNYHRQKLTDQYDVYTRVD